MKRNLVWCGFLPQATLHQRTAHQRTIKHSTVKNNIRMNWPGVIVTDDFDVGKSGEPFENHLRRGLKIDAKNCLFFNVNPITRNSFYLHLKIKSSDKMFSK